MEIGSVAIGDARDICVATKWRLWRHLVAAFLLYVGIGVLPDVVPTATPLCWPNTRKVILLVKGKQIESWFIKLLINDYEIIIKKFWLNNYLNNQPWNYILVGLVEISPCNLVFRALDVNVNVHASAYLLWSDSGLLSWAVDGHHWNLKNTANFFSILLTMTEDLLCWKRDRQ